MLHTLAWAYLEANQNIELAENLLKKCAKLRPDYKYKDYFRDTMGWLEYRKGNDYVAERELLHSRKKVSRESNIYGYTAVLYHLYFTWKKLDKSVLAQLVKNELLAQVSPYGEIRLYIKRVVIYDDSFLIANQQDLGFH